MALVVVDSGPVSAEDPLRIVPREKWRDLMLARRQFMEVKLSYDCRCLVEFVNDAELMFETLGFASVEDMVKDGYGLKPAEIKLAVGWLNLNPPKEAIPLKVAKELGERMIGIEGGRAGPGRGHKTADNVSRFNHGNSRAYILARLNRDGHAELATKVMNGELSANKAAIEAGFRKPPPTPFEQVKRLWPKLSEDEKAKMRTTP